MKTAILLGFIVILMATSHKSFKKCDCDCSKDVFLGTITVSKHGFSVAATNKNNSYSRKSYLHMMLLLLAGDVETNPGPVLQADSVNICKKCTEISKRKCKIQCDKCQNWWHLTCVPIKKAQASALTQWWCPSCLTDDASSQVSPDVSRPSVHISDESGHIDITEAIAKLRKNRNVISRIPKGARIQTAEALTKMIETALDEKSNGAWFQLFRFPFLALSIPARDNTAASQVSLTTKIKRQVADYMSGSASQSQLSSDEDGRLKSSRSRRGGKGEKRLSVDEALGKRVGAKLSDGDIKGAVRLLTSGDEIVLTTDDNVEKLASKHPAAPSDLDLPPCPDDSLERPADATEADVMAAISAFNPGSSAGLDGLRPAHLKDLTGRSAGEAGIRLLAALTSLVNTVAMGRLPECARDAFYSASLTALRKGDGGLRPIAVGSVYRRLATKVTLKPLTQDLGQQLRPVQLGYGTPGGCEAAVHAARHFFNNLEQNEVLIKIDMRNAFNTLRRDKFLTTVRQRVPSLYRLLWQAYSQPSSLYFGSARIESATGLQQGDPCGPAVFSIAVDAAAREARSDFNSWYLDDATIGGDIQSVCQDLKRVIPALSSIGLEVNPSKCEILLAQTSTGVTGEEHVRKLHQLIPGAVITPASEARILGAPVTDGAAEAVMATKHEDFGRMVGRLQYIDQHSALFLLRNCIWIPKLQYLLRAAPFYRQSDLLKPLDDQLRTATSAITNVHFDDDCWEQASLPTRYGGLGLRRTQDLALPSYTASLHHCMQLVMSMLPVRVQPSATEEIGRTVSVWIHSAGVTDHPTGDAARSQRAWDSVLAEKSHNSLLAKGNQRDHARLLSAATPESGSWLHAVPSARLGTLLDAETLRIAVALRVGADVCQLHQCRCGARADSRGHHALTCRLSAGRLPRHTALNDVIKRALQSAGIPSILEPTGVDRGDGKRPDGMTIFPFKDGKSLVWDATCVNTFAASYLSSAAATAGAAAKDAETRKDRKYECLFSRFNFQPVAFETAGACGPSTKTFVRQLGARVAAYTGDQREQAWLWQRLSLAVVRGNASSVLATAGPGKGRVIAEDSIAHPRNSSPEQHVPSEASPETADLLSGLSDIGVPSHPAENASGTGRDLLQTYRQLYEEMRAEAVQANATGGDIMADPELARYLCRPKPSSGQADSAKRAMQDGSQGVGTDQLFGDAGGAKLAGAPGGRGPTGAEHRSGRSPG